MKDKDKTGLEQYNTNSNKETSITKTLWENTIENYNKNPILKAIIQITSPFTLGILSAIEVGIITDYHNMMEKRLKILFSELEKGEIQLTPELIQSEEFLHCYFATTKAVLNSRRQEKITFFAKLFNSFISSDSFINIDEYEEYLKILDDLTYREILILFKLEEYEENYPHKTDENDLQRATLFWDSFATNLEKSLNIPKNELSSILTRLNRTGCYETFIGGYMGYSGGKGKLTPTYFQLKRLIKEKLPDKKVKE